MSKYEVGDKVWVRGFYEGKRPPGDHYIRVMLDDRPQLVIIRSSQIKPDVTFKWSPAKAKKKGSRRAASQNARVRKLVKQASKSVRAMANVISDQINAATLPPEFRPVVNRSAKKKGEKKK